MNTKTLVIYDNTGCIFLQRAGIYTVPQGGIQFMEPEVPGGKIISRIDVTTNPHTPVFEDLPLTDLQKVQNELTATQALVLTLQEQVLLN